MQQNPSTPAACWVINPILWSPMSWHAVVSFALTVHYQNKSVLVHWSRRTSNNYDALLRKPCMTARTSTRRTQACIVAPFKGFREGWTITQNSSFYPQVNLPWRYAAHRFLSQCNDVQLRTPCSCSSEVLGTKNFIYIGKRLSDKVFQPISSLSTSRCQFVHPSAAIRIKEPRI